MTKQIPKHIALFPISVVKEMTQLTARQIRYYEEQGLIKPARNDGNQRIFSLNDIERFLEIKQLIDEGVNIAGIKAVFKTKEVNISELPNEKQEKLLKMSADEWLKVVATIKEKYS